MGDDEDLVEEIISENQEGLERLAKEEPAEEARSRYQRLKRKIVSFFRKEEKTARITA